MHFHCIKEEACKERHKWRQLTHSSTGEEGGPSAHGVEVTLWRTDTKRGTERQGNTKLTKTWETKSTWCLHSSNNQTRPIQVSSLYVQNLLLLQCNSKVVEYFHFMLLYKSTIYCTAFIWQLVTVQIKILKTINEHNKIWCTVIQITQPIAGN